MDDLGVCMYNIYICIERESECVCVYIYDYIQHADLCRIPTWTMQRKDDATNQKVTIVGCPAPGPAIQVSP